MPIPFKFKAKNMETGEIAPVIWIFFNNSDKLTSIKVRIDDNVKIWTDFELFIWTGCKDCSGNEIYTGDIVKCGDTEYQIQFNRNDAFDMISKNLDQKILKISNECKIIGNISDSNISDFKLNKWMNIQYTK